MIQAATSAMTDRMAAPAAPVTTAGGPGSPAPGKDGKARPRRLRARAAFLWQPMFWGLTLTAIVLGGAVILGFLPVNDAGGGEIARTKFAYLLTAPPSEIGDTLAGIAGVLAFGWIIVTVWLQSIELAEQRKELLAQRLEMEVQRKATEAMARAMEAQAGIFEDEQKDRRERRAAEHIEALLESWLYFVRDTRFDFWTFSTGLAGAGAATGHAISLVPGVDGNVQQVRSALYNFCENLLRDMGEALPRIRRIAAGQAAERPESPVFDVYLPRSDSYRELLDRLLAIAALQPALSAAEQARLADCQLEPAIAALRTALAAEIWATEETAA